MYHSFLVSSTAKPEIFHMRPVEPPCFSLGLSVRIWYNVVREKRDSVFYCAAVKGSHRIRLGGAANSESKEGNV